MTANDLTASLLCEIPKHFPGARVWRNNRVKAMVTGRNGKPRMINAGIDGQGDITGIMPPYGQRIEIEVKIGADKQSEAQKNFEAMCHATGAAYIVARSVEQCIKDLGAYA